MVWGGHSCPPPLTFVFLRLEENDVLGKRDMLELRSAGVPPAVWRASRPPFGPAGGRRYKFNGQRYQISSCRPTLPARDGLPALG